MNIDLGPGRRVEISLLANDPSVPTKYRKGLENLQKLNNMRGEVIDLALIERLQSKHNQKPVHPRVAIEGGGPTGLLMAITQYQAGADVALFEKRSTFYDRTQIVRLDPKWMSVLKFYLGEEYHKLFTEEGCRGVLRSDGFGEIGTAFIEEALHDRLTRLMSAIPVPKGGIPPIERLAAYEIKGIKAKEGGGFQAVADYGKHYDPELLAGEKTPETAPAAEIKRDIDMLICSGGKNSPIRDQFLPSAIPVTEQQNYAVCSWITADVAGKGHETKPKPFPGQNPNEMNAFQDFRGVVHLDANFRNGYLVQLAKDCSESGLIGSSVPDKLAISVSQFFDNNVAVKAFKDPGPKQPYVQTRTFENLGLIYIGMEIPAEAHAMFAALETTLDEVVKSSREGSEERKTLMSCKDMLLKHAIQCWFQNIAKTYGMDTSHGLTLEKMDKHFVAMFPVNLQRLSSNHFFSQITKGDKSLFVAAAGDANNSPHFMRYSGLTGAREDILGLQKWTDAVASQKSSAAQAALKQQMQKDWERTAQFVISKGLAFLKPLPEVKISRLRKDKMEAILKKLAKGTKDAPSSSFRVIKGEGGSYNLVVGNKSQPIIPQEDGCLKMGGKTYDSFEQIKLEYIA